MYEAANAAIRNLLAFQDRYRGLVVRRGRKKAIVVIAHESILTINFMPIRRQDYRDSGFDFATANERKKASRWLKPWQRFR